MPTSLRQWNARQLCVLARYCSMHHVALTPDVVTGLARRYAAKHAAQRPDAAARPVSAR